MTFLLGVTTALRFADLLSDWLIIKTQRQCYRNWLTWLFPRFSRVCDKRVFFARFSWTEVFVSLMGSALTNWFYHFHNHCYWKARTYFSFTLVISFPIFRRLFSFARASWRQKKTKSHNHVSITFFTKFYGATLLAFFNKMPHKKAQQNRAINYISLIALKRFVSLTPQYSLSLAFHYLYGLLLLNHRTINNCTTVYIFCLL